MAATVYEKTMERAWRLLSYKPRTIAEMRERLLEKDWTDQTTVDQVIARLKELGYLNDDQYAKSFASSRLSVKPLGRIRLRRDLKLKKLPEKSVENALDSAYEERSEEELIDRAIEKRLRLKGAPSSREDSKKLFDFLLRRGFSYDLVIRKIRQIGRDVEPE